MYLFIEHDMYNKMCYLYSFDGLPTHIYLCIYCINRPFSKMVAENLNKSKLKTNTSTRKSTLTLVTLPRFSISGEISAKKM